MAKGVIERLVPDTSVIIQGLVSEQITKGELQVGEVILHEAVLAELEHQSNEGRASGYLGLDELRRLHEMSEKKRISLRFAGSRPGASEIRYAKLGEIDSIIRQLAYDEDAVLLTADKVQSRVAEARGVKVIFVPQKEYCPKPLKMDRFFDDTTMSVHLRDRVLPMAKKGTPGNWQFVAIDQNLMTAEEIKEISREMIEEAGCRTDGFLEIQREGSTIVQLGLYRTVILRPPFSDNWEITCVRPVRKLMLKDYEMSEKLRDRVSSQAEGILIAGAPGMGKSTFAQALVEQYAALGKIVKTVEAPRDLVLPDTITQLSYSRSTPEEVHDVLLLSRPDYSLFDEMRNVPDFLLFTDMRLAGVGMVGVVHGTNPLDAIQRFIGKIDLGVIPHVIDTVVFIKHGKVDQVLNINMIVKVPSGMTEADLARPIVVISDFESNKPVAEIYSYGEETVVVPVQDETPRGARALAGKHVERVFQRFSPDVKVDMVSEHKAVVYVPEKFIPQIIGQGGKNIQAMEKQLGIGLDIHELGEQPKKPKGEGKGEGIPYRVTGSHNHVEFLLGDQYSAKDVDIYLNDEYLATFAVGKKGVVRIKRSNKFGKTLMDAMDNHEKIAFVES